MTKYKQETKSVLYLTLCLAGGFILGSSLIRSIKNEELTLREDNLIVFIVALVVAVAYRLLSRRNEE